MSRTEVITIDGPAGVGKTTLARRVAAHIGITYLDTGAMFRAVAWKLGQQALQWDSEQLNQALGAISFTLEGDDGGILCLDGEPLPQSIRTEEVGFLASSLAKLPPVRATLKKQQRVLGESRPLVAEGRDMGTVVFPDARHKFFLDATPEERARRRYEQLLHMGESVDRNQLLNQIRLRDEQDRNRELAPLCPASDAHVIDTTDLDLEGVFQAVIRELPDG